jgi:hypothetical protein
LILLLAFHFLIILFANFRLNPLNLARLLLVSALTSGLLLRGLRLSWFFYFIVLVFLGGVIVVVLFICSVCTNKKLFTNNNYMFKSVLFLIFIARIFFKKIIIPINFFSRSLIIRLFLKERATLLIFLLIILLVCMICVIFISKLDQGPLLKIH